MTKTRFNATALGIIVGLITLIVSLIHVETRPVEGVVKDKRVIEWHKEPRTGFFSNGRGVTPYHYTVTIPTKYYVILESNPDRDYEVKKEVFDQCQVGKNMRIR